MNERYTITLADGAKIKNLRMNGNYFVSDTEINADIFDNNLDTVSVSDGESGYAMRNAELIQLEHYDDGWYFALREIPKDVLERQRLEMDLEQTQLALCDLYEQFLAGTVDG